MKHAESKEAMKQGHKISHRYFSDNEFYELKDGKIISEDGINHTSTFNYTTGDGAWRDNGWYIKSETPKP